MVFQKNCIKGNFAFSHDVFQQWTNSVFGTEYEYKYYRKNQPTNQANKSSKKTHKNMKTNFKKSNQKQKLPERRDGSAMENQLKPNEKTISSKQDI